MNDAQKSQIVKKQREAERLAKNKQKKFERKKKKIQEKKKKEKNLLAPHIKNNIVEWRRKNENQNLFEGVFNDELIFEIKPGILTFSLKIKSKNILNFLQKNKKSMNINSPYLKNLQKKANDILLEFISRS